MCCPWRLINWLGRCKHPSNATCKRRIQLSLMPLSFAHFCIFKHKSDMQFGQHKLQRNKTVVDSRVSEFLIRWARGLHRGTMRSCNSRACMAQYSHDADAQQAQTTETTETTEDNRDNRGNRDNRENRDNRDNKDNRDNNHKTNNRENRGNKGKRDKTRHLARPSKCALSTCTLLTKTTLTTTTKTLQQGQDNNDKTTMTRQQRQDNNDKTTTTRQQRLYPQRQRP